MPEGPEIRLAADEIAAALVGHVVEELFFAFDQLKPYEEKLRGVCVTAVSSRAKAMLIQFANGYTIYSHNQLYGIWIVRDAYDYPETGRQLRLAIHTMEKSALLYSASAIEVWPTAELEEHPFLKKLGPDLLDLEVTVDGVAAQFQSDRFRRRRFISLMLDQRFLAGLGNYLRSEILFVAKVHPNSRPMDCTDSQIEALAHAAVHLTRQSYQTRGITNDLKLAYRLRDAGEAYRDYRFWVFNRQDRPCYQCGTSIRKEVMGGRRLYYCPSCQAVSNGKH